MLQKELTKAILCCLQFLPSLWVPVFDDEDDTPIPTDLANVCTTNCFFLEDEGDLSEFHKLFPIQ